MGKEIDTRAIGLDAGLSFIKWLTGAENLHYGLWTDLEVNAGNLRAAQDAYTTKLFKLLPEGPLKILDIGGGAGETARKLLALGHTVDIVVPSAFLADRCRNTAPGATVHEMIFEDFETDQKFDLCLFSESYQYIPLDEGLPKALSLLTSSGHVIVSDLFRNPNYFPMNDSSIVGGGHALEEYRQLIEDQPVEVVSEENITDATAPSVDIEQGLFNVVGFATSQVDSALREGKPILRWFLNKAWRMFTSERKRTRLDSRLNDTVRNREVFAKFNTYLMVKLARKP